MAYMVEYKEAAKKYIDFIKDNNIIVYLKSTADPSLIKKEPEYICQQKFLNDLKTELLSCNKKAVYEIITNNEYSRYFCEKHFKELHKDYSKGIYKTKGVNIDNG